MAQASPLSDGKWSVWRTFDGRNWTLIEFQRLRFSPISRGSVTVLGGEAINPPISEAATDTTAQDFSGAFGVGQFAGVVAQIELGAVTAKVGFAHVVIGADHAALEDREEVFGGVGVLEAAGGDILLGRVIDDRVTVKLLAEAGVDGALVGHKVGGALHVGNEDAANGCCVDVSDMERTGHAIALHKGNNGLLGGRLTGGAVLGLAAYIGFVGFNNAVRLAAHGASGCSTFHCLADAVAKEPSSLVGDADHTGHLRGAHAFLGSGHDVRSKQPLVKRNVRALHDGASANGELVTAIVAKEHTGLRLAAHLTDGKRTTVRASGFTAPTLRFNVRSGLGFVVEDGVGDVHVHADCMPHRAC